MYSQAVSDVVLIDRLVSIILQNLSFVNQSHFFWLHARPGLACFFQIFDKGLVGYLHFELLAITLTNGDLYLCRWVHVSN